jgi:putative nucleotidyltransferase with HDIG domain
MIGRSRTFIPSGSFQIARSKGEIYESILGTCVGVAIVDRHAGIGGLYHILLPEPPTPGSTFDPKLYASSGLPLFLDSLLSAGAHKANMEVVLAGGALIGEISRTDLNLDIGGRTVENVNHILKAEAIPVVRSETGGFFGATLSLNLESLACEILPAFSDIHKEKVPIGRLSSRELDLAVQRVKPIPQVALKIIRTLQMNDYSLMEIANEVRQDQVITAKVLKICNSVFVSSKENIKSIDQAIVMLGGRLIGQLILSSSMGQFFEGKRRGYSMAKGGLYHHAVMTAIVSEQISKIIKKSAPDIAYTAGLLHDIGKVLLDQYVEHSLPLFYRRVISEGINLLEAERSLFGISHAEAGTRLAELWEFPDSLRDVIAHHDRPSHAQHDKTLTYLVYLADLLVSRFDFGRELDLLGTEELAEGFRHLDLTSTSFRNLIGQIPWKILATPGYF